MALPASRRINPQVKALVWMFVHFGIPLQESPQSIIPIRRLKGIAEIGGISSNIEHRLDSPSLKLDTKIARADPDN
jgi:hypothetical protein